MIIISMPLMREKVKKLIKSEFKEIKFVKEIDMKLFYEFIIDIDKTSYIEKLEYSIKQMKYCNVLNFYIELKEMNAKIDY